MVLALSLPVLAPTPLQAAAETYVIDPDHSRAQFEITHLLFSTVTGRFTKLKGTLMVDPADLSKASAEVEIDASSIDTAVAMRDKDLRSPRFFDVANYPTITFKSTAVTATGTDTLQVAGNLTMHGVTKQVVIAVTGWASGTGAKGTPAVGFRKGTLTLKRSDYGITTLKGPVGDDVDITLSVEANKQQ
jgi:polyisoprenoid-binding protein YceI